VTTQELKVQNQAKMPRLRICHICL